MQTIVDGLAIRYADEGKGPLILFLHGWKDSLHTFDSIAPALSSSFRVVRLDLPGFGESEMPAFPWKLDNYVLFVNDFLSKLNIKPDIIVGHSLGGRILIKGVSTKELYPKKIVLISSAGIAKRRTMRNLVLTALAKIAKAATLLPPLCFWRTELRRTLYTWIGSDYFAAGAMRRTFLNIIGEDLRSFASAITMPTLLIWGSEDKTTPLSDGERLSKIIKGSRLRIIPGAGHFVHRERSAEVIHIIREFI